MHKEWNVPKWVREMGLLIAGVGIGLLVIVAMVIAYAAIERIISSFFLMTLVVSGTAVLVHNSGRTRQSKITLPQQRGKKREEA